MRSVVTGLLIVCAEAALWIADRLKGGAKRLVANDLNGRRGRQRSDGK